MDTPKVTTNDSRTAPTDPPNADGGQSDELYEEAVQLMVNTGHASISLVQRRLRINFSRAARLMDAMERAGVVSPLYRDTPRKVLVKAEGR